MPIRFPAAPTIGDVFNSGHARFVWDGVSWNNANAAPTIATIPSLADVLDAKAASTNPSFVGSMSISPSSSADGIKIDSGYAWIDLIGDVTPKSSGANSAGWDTFRGSLKSWSHPASTIGDLQYHVPHEYAVGTDIFLHLHWGHQGTNITGSLIVDFDVSVVNRGTAQVVPAPITRTMTVSGLNITNSPQYCHRVDEIQLSNAGGTGGLLDTSAIAVDSLIIVHYTINTIPSITGGTKNVPFLFTADIHMQSNNIGTKNKDPNFYA